MAEKKGLIHKLIVGKDKAEGYARSTLPSNRWELFWDVLKGRFWKLVIINLLLLVALIPTGLVFLLKSANIARNGTSFPFGGSYMIGYHQIPGLYRAAAAYEVMINIQTFALLIPALMFAAVIFSGVFHILRNLAWSEGVFIANDFWKGLKSNIVNFLLICLMYAVMLFIANLNITSLNQVSITSPDSFLAGSFVNTLFKGLTYVFAVFFSIMAFFAFTVNVTYQVKLFQLIKNCFILTLGLLMRNVFFFALCMLPFLLIILFPSGMLIGLIMGVVLLLGFSGAGLGWTIYSQWVFDMFLNDKVEGSVKNRGIYQKVDKEGKPIKKTSQKRFENPKKKRAVKPVTDEDIVLTELPKAFSRADLKKLEDEKQVMRADSEKWAEEHADDNYDDSYDDEDDNASYDDDSAYEGYEDAMRLDGYEKDEQDEDE